MFKATTVEYVDLPDDVNRDFFSAGVEKYYDDYLVVQVDGKTIYCRPESELQEGLVMTIELMEMAYYLGILEVVKHKSEVKNEFCE